MGGSQGRDNWAAMHRAFGWSVPPRFNIAQACCGRWAQRSDAGERVAIFAHASAGAATLTFAQLQREANAMSRLLVELGRYDEARVEIAELRRRDRMWKNEAMATELEARIRNAEAASGDAGDIRAGQVDR